MLISTAHHRWPALKHPGLSTLRSTQCTICQRAVSHRTSAVLPPAPDVAVSCLRSTALQQTISEALHIAAGRGHDARETLETLRSLLPQHALERVLRECPQLLTADIGTWQAFFSAYGAPDSFLSRLIERAPRFFLSACLFSAGNVLLAFRTLGIDPEEALELIVLDTPGVLNVPSEQVAERIALMRMSGLSDAEIADAIVRDPMGTVC